MNTEMHQLFWDIIDCPNANKESCPNCNCHSVIATQNDLPFRQVPEPWSGQLSVASFLLIAGNPAIVKNELFPSKDVNWNKWDLMPGSVASWSKTDVEDFFCNRFNGAKYPGNGQPYVDNNKQTTLRVSSGIVVPVKFQNRYWPVYNAYCKAIDPTFKDYSFVVTDFVHCKSKGEKGVKQAIGNCLPFMSRIIKLFLLNGQASHRILLFGQKEDYVTAIMNWLSSLGTISNCSLIGSFKYKNPRATNPSREIKKCDFVYEGITSEVFFYIPKPSGANHASSPVSFMKTTIEW